MVLKKPIITYLDVNGLEKAYYVMTVKPHTNGYFWC
jgi:hypothetical protein